MLLTKKTRSIIGVIGAIVLGIGAGGIFLPRGVVNWGLSFFVDHQLLEGGRLWVMAIAFIVVFVAIVLLAISEGDDNEAKDA